MKLNLTVYIRIYTKELMTKSHPSNDTFAVALAGDLRVIIGKFKRKLRAQGGIGDLTPQQVSVLSQLLERDSHTTVSQLARAEGMRSQSMGAIVATLDASGLVRGTPDAKDGRRVLLSLTPKCHALIARARAAREDWLARMIQTELTKSEQEQLANGIELLKRLTDL
jgi:DNA-binding MarR family transcriptional regulator